MPITLPPSLAPERIHLPQQDGSYLIKVIPPAITKLPASEVSLTASQFERYLMWRRGKVMIQDALPELTADQREMLMTGIGPAAWDRLFPPEDDKDD